MDITAQIIKTMPQDAKLLIISNYKNLAVTRQKYQIASELREIEKLIQKNEGVSDEQWELFTNNSKTLSTYTTHIGDKYKCSDEACIEAGKLMESANALRTQANAILQNANALVITAFEVLRTDNSEIPDDKETGLVFVKETKSVIVFKTH